MNEVIVNKFKEISFDFFFSSPNKLLQFKNKLKEKVVLFICPYCEYVYNPAKLDFRGKEFATLVKNIGGLSMELELCEQCRDNLKNNMIYLALGHN